MTNISIKKLKKHRYWYKNTRKALKNKYGKNYKIFTAILSATSPRCNVKKNFSITKKIFNDYLQNKDDIINLFINNKNEALKKYKIMYCSYNNLLKIFSFNWDSHKKFELSGQKVNSFYNNLIGNYHFVTLDIWILRYFKHDKDYFNITDYKKYTRIIKNASKKYNMLPCEFQALIWIKIRLKYGFKPVSFLKFI